MKPNPAKNRSDRSDFSFRAPTPKTTWHPLSLQQLKPREFVDVVNAILDGRHEIFAGSLKGARADRECESPAKPVAAVTA